MQVIRAWAEGHAAAELRAAVGAGADDVARIVPDRVLEEVEAPPEMDPAAATFRLLDSVTRFLKSAAAEQPLVVLLDDLHAADPSSLALLDFLVREMSEARLLVVGTYRDVEVGPEHPLSRVLADVLHRPITRRLALRGLAPEEVRALVESVAGVAPSNAALIALSRQTDGNPFFVGEIVRLLLSEDSTARLTTERPGTLVVPVGVRSVIGRRLDALPAGSRDLLAVAAVLGRSFAVPPLARAAGHGSEDVLALLEPALSARLVSEIPETLLEFRFAHALIRDVLYVGLPLTRRLALHRAVGEALEAIHGLDTEPVAAELAYHFGCAAAAGVADKAVAYACRAAERAISRLAFGEAVHHYQRALEVQALQGEPAERQRCELLVALAGAQHDAGEAREAAATSEQAGALARSLGDPQLVLRAALASGSWWDTSAPFAEAKLLEEALADTRGESSLRALGLARFGASLHWRASGHAARRWSTRPWRWPSVSTSRRRSSAA